MLADTGVASLTASADGLPVEVSLVDIGLPSGRKLAVVGFDGIADELVLNGLDAAGNTIATLVHDVAELRQADGQRETKYEEVLAVTELAMAAPPTILASPSRPSRPMRRGRCRSEWPARPRSPSRASEP